jgi:hypothetical protein
VDTPGEVETIPEVQPEASGVLFVVGGNDRIHESLSDIETYLNDLLLKAAPAWEAIPDADAWLAEIRGTSSFEET